MENQNTGHEETPSPKRLVGKFGVKSLFLRLSTKFDSGEPGNKISNLVVHLKVPFSTTFAIHAPTGARSSQLTWSANAYKHASQ